MNAEDKAKLIKQIDGFIDPEERKKRFEELVAKMMRGHGMDPENERHKRTAFLLTEEGMSELTRLECREVGLLAGEFYVKHLIESAE